MKKGILIEIEERIKAIEKRQSRLLELFEELKKSEGATQ